MIESPCLVTPLVGTFSGGIFGTILNYDIIPFKTNCAITLSSVVLISQVSSKITKLFIENCSEKSRIAYVIPPIVCGVVTGCVINLIGIRILHLSQQHGQEIV